MMETVTSFVKKDSFVLFLAEGNFSFSANVITTHWAETIQNFSVYSTCYEDDFVSEFAMENASKLARHGVKVLTSVDATNIQHTSELKSVHFDLVFFMFPHIGGKMKIQKNRDLVKNFAINLGASLKPGALVVVGLAGGQGGTPLDTVQRREPDHWQVVKTMAQGGFELVNALHFKELAQTLPEYQSHGYRGWSQGFHTEKGVIHLFKQPEDKLVWFRDYPASPKDLYVAEKLTRLRQSPCYIGQVWKNAMTHFGLCDEDIQVIRALPSAPGCYLVIAARQELAYLGDKCSVTPMICVEQNVKFDAKYYSHQKQAGTVLIDIGKTAEEQFSKEFNSVERFSWHHVWKGGCSYDRPFISLFPPQYEHCISFWLPADKTQIEEEELAWGLLVSGNDSVSACHVIDVYRKDGRIANTLQIRYKSHFFALSPSQVIQLQEKSIGGFLDTLGCTRK